MMSFVVWLALLFLIPAGVCGQNSTLQKETLLETDRQFAKLAVEAGTFHAFDRFMTDDATLIPRFGHPIHGREALRSLTSEIPEKTEHHIPLWKPIATDVARYGDMGYTFGRYPLTGNDTTAYEDVLYNYYISMWKRQRNGAWKMVFHVGLLNLEGVDVPLGEKKTAFAFGDAEMGIVETDRAFSRLSEEEGYLEAFYRHIADDGLALSGGGRPPNNKERYRRLVEYYEDKELPAFTLVWEPIYGSMSASGELGFTHGRYRSMASDGDGKEEVGYGYYLSVWKMQSDGTWKFVLDGGNQSPPNGISLSSS